MNAPTLIPATRERLRAHLAGIEADYSPEVRMIRSVWNGPGYHSCVPNGTVVHQLHGSLDYALLLLANGSEASVTRAGDILAAVLELQDTDPTSATYGIWPWLQEEPLAKMRPPDWNWADFCGVRLAHAFGAYGERLGAGLRVAVKIALGHAARSIFRRNVGPGYTNIAIKGAVVCAVAGELIDDASLVNYGRVRLANVLAHAEHHEGYNEFNSPNYGLLVLTELERGLLLTCDVAVRELLEKLHAFTWRQLAGMFHPGTGQLCGPQSRAYQDLLPESFVAFAEEALGRPVFRPSNRAVAKSFDAVGAFVIPRLPCPVDVLMELDVAAGGVNFHRQYFVKSPRAEECRAAAVWRAPQACLGSMNLGSFWVQQRAILGYWRVGDAAAVLRVRMTHDGKDFASGLVWTNQCANELAAIAGLAIERGDHHDHLDRPADGVFRVADLQVAITVEAPDAAASTNADGGFSLQAGDWSAEVRPAFAWFGGHPVWWESFAEKDRAGVRLVVNAGEAFVLAPARLEEAAIGFHLALRERHAPRADVRVDAGRQDGRARLTTVSRDTRLAVDAPLKPAALPYFKG